MVAIGVWWRGGAGSVGSNVGGSVSRGKVEGKGEGEGGEGNRNHISNWRKVVYSLSV